MFQMRKMLRLKTIISGRTGYLLLCTILLSSHPTESANSGLQIEVQNLPEDCAEKSAVGDKVEIHYTGKLENGKIFDSSIERKRDPIGLTLGAGQVIEGWEKGLLDMCVGEKRRLVIPPSMGYGDAGYPPVIPGGAKLNFEVTMMSLEKRAQASSSFDPLSFVKFLAVPLILGYVVYFMYSRYKQEVESRKEEKKKSRKRK